MDKDERVDYYYSNPYLGAFCLNFWVTRIKSHKYQGIENNTHTHTNDYTQKKIKPCLRLSFDAKINITKLQKFEGKWYNSRNVYLNKEEKISSQIYDFRKHTNHAFFLKKYLKPYPNSLKDKYEFRSSKRRKYSDLTGNDETS